MPVKSFPRPVQCPQESLLKITSSRTIAVLFHFNYYWCFFRLLQL
ncbi:hypothetical protein SLEP1_g55011 [Rubroshorea leprosula]|uniref:Uncharacterized protein n=1 Tax=Rubroshorea leprosula TaxID=152421 RepID=A0AAV5MF01_9ROSI|nr:hypothetical protein SLEP1_g55011 [Rubroshorea leprosula]